MYEPYDYGDPVGDEGGHRVKPRGLKKSSRWVFISRKADIGIILVLLLGSGFGVMWFVSQLPFFVEIASNHYHWAKDVYATWGTPSMRWLFINLVVGVIVATSGLLSAFGGDSSGQDANRTAAYDKGVSYRGGSDPGVIYGGADPAYNASGARFAGAGYESPLYNPYVEEHEPAKSGRVHHESSFGAWDQGDDDDDRHIEEDETGEGFRDDRFRGMHGANNEPYARPVDPVEVMRAARPVSRQGSQRRGVPMPDEVPMPMSRGIPREMPPRESFREIPKDMPPTEEPPPPREAPVSREIPVPTEAPAAEEAPPPPELAPKPDVVEHVSGVGSSARKEDGIEIISKIYDTLPVPELEEVGTEHGKFHRLKTDPAIHYTPQVDEASDDGSPAKPEVLHKSHTFTLGRVIRRDQLVDFIEPFSRKLEGIGRKVRDPHKSSQSEFGNQSRELPAPPPVLQGAAAEAAGAQSEPHRRRLSAESIPVVPTRRLASESVPLTEGKQVSAPVAIKHPFASIVKKPSSPPSPVLKQRSIVYPPALLSQACGKDEDLSPPGSPPIEEAIPPPPPPHLKLPPTKDTDSSSITSSEELPSFKFYLPTSPSPEPSPAAKSSKRQVEKASIEDKKPPSGKHSRTPSNIPSTSSQSTGPLEAGSSSSGLQDRSVVVKPRKSNGGDEKVAEAKEESAGLDRQESSSVKDDDLHQQIEDFLARFHENWRLQRQESLARYKKRLVELDE